MSIRDLKTKSKQDIVVDHIWDLYKKGSLTVGSFIPSERQLMIKFEFSRNTVRHAISKLVTQDYLEPIQGKGYRIKEKIENNFSSFQTVFPGKEKTTEFISLEKTKGFHKESGIMDPVILYKYRCVDDVPFMLTIQYIPNDIWIRMNQEKAKDSLYESLYELAITRPEYKMHKSKKRISLMQTPEFAKKHLDSLEEHTVEFKSRSMSKTGIILEFSVNYYNSRYFTHSWVETSNI